jgi:hypothetical protein
MSWESDVARDINRDVNALWNNSDDQGARQALLNDALRFNEPDPNGGSRGDFMTISRVNDALSDLHSSASVLDDGQIVSNSRDGQLEIEASSAGVFGPATRDHLYGK